jgi:WD40 repeat protein
MQILSIPRKKRIYSTAFSPSGRYLAAPSGDGFLRIWDTTSGDVQHAIPIEETSCGYDVTYLDEDRLIFAGTQLRCWTMAANDWTVIVPNSGWARQVGVSPDGAFLARVDRSTSTEWGGSGLCVHDTATWRPAFALVDETHTTGGLAFSPDGGQLATGHIVHVGARRRSFGVLINEYTVPEYEYTVRLRELPSGRIVKSIEGWQQGVSNLSFSPDGRVLAGTAGPRLRVWDLAADREIALQKRGTKHFQGVSFTDDGRYLATVSNDETVRIWDARSWQEHTTFTWQIGRLLNIAFAPDGCRAAAGSDQGKIVIWDVDG